MSTAQVHPTQSPNNGVSQLQQMTFGGETLMQSDCALQQDVGCAAEARQGARGKKLATNNHRRRLIKANAFFKIAEKGNDKSDADVTWYIEQQWVDVNVQDHLQCNAVHYAVAKNRPTLVAWLVRHGVDINHPNKRGRTPLHSAAERGRGAMIDVLMENGAAAAMDMYDKEGNTPFHVAVMNCEVNAVRAFLRHGADRLHPTQHGKLPEALAGRGNRNLQLLGTVRSLLAAGSQPNGSAVSESSSLGSSPQAVSIPVNPVLGLQSSVASDLSGWDSLSVFHSTTIPDLRDQGPAAVHDAPGWQTPPAALSPRSSEAGRAADKPENMVLAVSLVRKLMPMLQMTRQFSATPRLQSSLSLAEPLLNSLHKALSRLRPPGDIEPHLTPMLSTLVNMWRVVEAASKPPKGLAGRLKLSLSLHSGSKVDAELDQLDGELHIALGHLSAQLLQVNSVLGSASPHSSRSAASSSPTSQALQPASALVPASPRSGQSAASSSPGASLPLGTAPAFGLPQPLAAQTSAASSRDISRPAPPAFAPAVPPPLPESPGGADAMVGMEQVVSEISGLLQTQSEGRVVLLLDGLVGVGKTAAARATFEHFGRALAPGVLAHWVGLRPGLSTSELLGRQRSMLWMLAGQGPAASTRPVHTLAEGRSGMRALLEGKKVLMVVDGASGSQLEELFPPDVMTLLAPSSVVILTSRDRHAAAPLQLPPGSSVVSYNVRPLSDELAMELFCQRAFKSAWPTPQQETLVRGAVEQCGGLPLAVEAMALACARGDSDPDLFSLYGDGNANRLFRALHEAVGLLTPEEREVLQDVAVFLVGADWGAVEAYCGPGVLAALERGGLVEREPAGTAGLAYPVEAFCDVLQQDGAGQARLNVQPAEDCEVALSEGVRGVCFNGVDLQLHAATQQHLGHRMLLLDGCMLQGQLQWSFQQLRWLSWRGPQMAGFMPAGRMEPLVQAGLHVLLLDHLPFESIDLQSLQGLKHLIIADMPYLTAIEGLPQLTQLTHIDLKSCPLLNSLRGRPLPPNLRHLRSSPSHPQPTPPLTWVNHP